MHPPQNAAPPPAGNRLPDRLLILSVFVVASCGLAYELIAGALSSYLLGDSVLQFSSIIGCYLFAMGVGSHLSKYVDDRDVLARFIDIELLVGLIGGVSATLLFLLFAWMAAPFRTTLYALVFILGVLVGMEIPLVMRVLHSRQASFSELVIRCFSRTHSASSLAWDRVSWPTRSSMPFKVSLRTTTKVANASVRSENTVIATQMAISRARRV